MVATIPRKLNILKQQKATLLWEENNKWKSKLNWWKSSQANIFPNGQEVLFSSTFLFNEVLKILADKVKTRKRNTNIPMWMEEQYSHFPTDDKVVC